MGIGLIPSRSTSDSRNNRDVIPTSCRRAPAQASLSYRRHRHRLAWVPPMVPEARLRAGSASPTRRGVGITLERSVTQCFRVLASARARSPVGRVSATRGDGFRAGVELASGLTWARAARERPARASVPLGSIPARRGYARMGSAKWPWAVRGFHAACLRHAAEQKDRDGRAPRALKPCRRRWDCRPRRARWASTTAGG
jgi:hypothetical protein